MPRKKHSIHVQNTQLLQLHYTQFTLPIDKWESHIYNFLIMLKRPCQQPGPWTWFLVFDVDILIHNHAPMVVRLHICPLAWRLSRFTGTIGPKFAQSPQALKIFAQSKQPSSSLTCGKNSGHLLQGFLSYMISLLWQH